MTAFEPRLKVWIEHEGRLVMSDYRLALLEIIAESGSLAGAAGRLRLSYRRAWGKVKELEANLGIALVSSEVGGTRGGQTHLTTEGKALVEAFRQFRSCVEREADRAFRETVGPVLGHGHHEQEP